MARRVDPKNQLKKCDYCGELYSVTYKHCPFCNEDGTGRWDDPETPPQVYDEEDYEPSRGGKRLAGGSGGGRRGGPSIGRIIGTVVSLALIVAAVCIVISIVKPMLTGREEPGKESPGTESSVPSAAPSEAVSAPPAESDDPAAASPAGEASQPPQTSQAPSASAGTPTGFTLNREDFTFDAPGQVFTMKAAFTPEGTSADITWKSSDPNVASVSWNGVVTSISKGTVTLTATVDGVGEQTCIVRCNFESGSGAAASSAPAGGASVSSSASGLSLNREDFTLSHAGETFRMVVSGTSSSVTWASSNSSVATIGTDGTVTAVAKGTCSVTATVDGVTLKCIVRCSF